MAGRALCRAAVAGLAAASLAAVPAPAGAAWPVRELERVGYCTTASSDPDALARAVGALGLGVPATAPIAVLDSGVDATTPELAGRVLPALDAATGQPVAGDLDGHGTGVASVAAGVPGGVSPSSPILPIRIFDAAGDSSAEIFARGIDLAVAKGASVINVSGAGAAADAAPADVALASAAINRAFTKGVLVVTASGNTGDGAAQVPANLAHVLVAGSTGWSGGRADFSSTGPWVDVAAPAEGITVSQPRDLCASGYASVSGTSFAAPALAGAAAIVSQVRRALTVQQRFELVRRAAGDLPPAGRDDDTGFGLLDVRRGLSAPAPAKDSSAEVDDDPYWVRGKYRKGHPVALQRSRRFKARGSVSPAKDPADVYPVRLAKGERLTASVRATSRDGLLDVTVYGPAAGDFDVTRGITRHLVAGTGGYSAKPTVKLRARRNGIYYLAVGAAAATDPDDPDAAVPATAAYRLAVSKQRAPRKTRRR